MVLAHISEGNAAQALLAHKQGRYDEARTRLSRFEDAHRRQKFPEWQQRAYDELLLAEAQAAVTAPPPMSRLSAGE
jgi:serine/threonine-protein kinase RIO1